MAKEGDGTGDAIKIISCLLADAYSSYVELSSMPASGYIGSHHAIHVIPSYQHPESRSVTEDMQYFGKFHLYCGGSFTDEMEPKYVPVVKGSYGTQEFYQKNAQVTEENLPKQAKAAAFLCLQSYGSA